MPGPFVRRVALRNYKSVARCDVELRPLTVLVGRNGSGKSNFVDALAFVAEALRTSLDHAIRSRGSIVDVRRMSNGHPLHVAIELSIDLDAASAVYALRIGMRPDLGWYVSEEHCTVRTDDQSHEYLVQDGTLRRSTEQILGPATEDRLLLGAAASLPAFRGVFEALAGMVFYNFNPSTIRAPHERVQGDVLSCDGANLTSVLESLQSSSPSSVQSIVEYLQLIVPELVSVRVSGDVHPALLFEHASSAGPLRLRTARHMSDGTLRALAILVALFQTNGRRRLSLIGIEEPETALHPAAAGVLLGALQDQSRDVQVIVTTHSADLLDREQLPIESILAVNAQDGITTVAHLDEVSRGVLRDQLFTAGELLRMDHLSAEPTASPEDR